MRKVYQDLEASVYLFSAEDIVTLSDNAKDDVADDIFGQH